MKIIKKIPVKFTIFSIIGFLGAHLLVSTICTLVIERSYRHRLVDVTRGTGDNIISSRGKIARKIEIAFGHLKSNYSTTKPNILFLGSSYTWGYSYNEDKTFTKQIQNKYDNLNIINLSIVGTGGCELPYQSLMYMINNGMYLDKVIIEFHLSKIFKKDIELYDIPEMYNSNNNPINNIARTVHAYLIEKNPYFAYFFFNPGINKAYTLLFDNTKGSIKEHRKMLMSTFPNDYIPTEEQFHSYIKKGIPSAIYKTINAAYKVSDEVYLMPALMNYNAAAHTGISKKRIQEQIAFVEDVTSKQYPNLKFLRLDKNESLQDDHWFRDISHLNVEGLANLASILDHTIELSKYDLKSTD